MSSVASPLVRRGKTKMVPSDIRRALDAVELPDRFRIRASRRLTTFVDLYITLGKALINGRRTVEGYWRIDASFAAARKVTDPEVLPILVYSGWGGGQQALSTEAWVFKLDLESILRGQGLCWPGVILTETRARFTVENILYSIQLVHWFFKRKLRPARCLIRQITVVSTDYHVMRLWDIDWFFPEISDIRPARATGANVDRYGAPYVYLTCADEARHWLARFYVALHRLSLLQVNLQGLAGWSSDGQVIHPGTVGELRRVSLVRLDETTALLTRLQQEAPAVSHKGPLGQKLEYARGELPKILEFLGPFALELQPLVDVPYAEAQQPDWKARLQHLNETCMYPVRSGVDPDEPG